MGKVKQDIEANEMETKEADQDRKVGGNIITLIVVDSYSEH
jgi:hypothetical protein